MVVTQSYRWRFNVFTRHSPSTGWRQKLAASLRSLAHKVDGREEFILTIDSTPSLTINQISLCVDRGSKAMQEAVEYEVRNEAIELVMRRYAPHLYAEVAG